MKNPKGAHFQATLTWHDRGSSQKYLNERPDGFSVARAKYIPQNFFEKVCNEIAAGESTAFDEEIKDVIFSHVPLDARLGQTSLKELVRYRTSEMGKILIALRTKLKEINLDILEMQSHASEEYRAGQEKHLEAKQAELDVHELSRPPEVPKPGEAGDAAAREGTAKMEAARNRLAKVDSQISDAKVAQKRLAQSVAISVRAIQRVENLRQQIRPLVAALAEDLGLLDIPQEGVVQFLADEGTIRAKGDDLRQEKLDIDNLLSEVEPTSLIRLRKEILAEIDAIQAELDEPGRRYQLHLHELRLWEEKRVEIIGSQEISGSLKYYEDILARLGDLPISIEERKAERMGLVKDIYGKLVELKAVYEELYYPVQKFIDGHSIAKEQFRLNFDVEITNTGFADGFFSYINQQVSGSFCGKGAGEEQLAAIMMRHDFNTEGGALNFTQEIERALTNDMRKPAPETVSLITQMRKGVSPETVYDYVFGLEYLMPKYSLQMAGKNLDQLSPGEKGSLLLVFYLLVDQNDTPLLIDQPEENLDNQTIVTLLVPSIKEAKGRRQIFVVTHNANLAVVCDAEQIICATHEPDGKNKITYQSGSIENPEINNKILDILEGTKPAFDNRSLKYQ